MHSIPDLKTNDVGFPLIAKFPGTPFFYVEPFFLQILYLHKTSILPLWFLIRLNHSYNRLPKPCQESYMEFRKYTPVII